ncbi:hypothetical protein AMTR_s00194p00041600 [Amborella trichopoda]|uniref:Uncharacterized protein n=1 Tax=Amborella trichopoda TaxID=13333 RepID=U5DC21_AMBTC|nr:hypothetical protein AMTR_s00194p00041600 [Amborella trichopoda]
MFDAHAREDVDAAIARCYYAHGISFNVVKGPQFQEILYAIYNALKGYFPPKYERLRTSLLDKERSRIDSQHGGKAMFVNGYDCSEIEHTSQNIADILLKAIDHKIIVNNSSL